MTPERTVWRRIQAALPASALLLGVTFAQVPGETVQWSTAVVSDVTDKQDGELRLSLSGRIADGWHVYAPTQAPGGPTPLRVTLEENGVAERAGALSGTVPEKQYDPSFALETRFYAHAFTLYLPIRLKARPAGAVIPVSVRFQACTGQVCEPPWTVHLSVPIDPQRMRDP